jgi:hypothetical protein
VRKLTQITTLLFELAPGDRSHIPEASKPIYVSLQRLMNQMKQGLPVSHHSPVFSKSKK